MLNQAAKTMLLRLIELNGGSIHRGDLNAALHELQDHNQVEVQFIPESPKNHTDYRYKLTPKGQEDLERIKAEKVKQLEVTEIKRKKDRATVLEYKNNTYILQPQAVNKNKGAAAKWVK
ncbi:hypothetical protein ACF5W4_11215 [Bacillota bacterium Lsc_1132]